MKVCFKCKEKKAIDEYYKHPKMADGHLGKCKDCTKRDVIVNREANAEYYREYDSERAKLPKRKASSAAISSRWRRSDSRHTRAHNAVTRAVRAGKLLKCKCERCGRQNAHAHHDDYDFPLQVMWLCPLHHKERHKELKAMGE